MSIYYGYGFSSGPDSCFDWWMSSSDRGANIRNKGFRDVGIGIRKGTYKTYDVQRGFHIRLQPPDSKSTGNGRLWTTSARRCNLRRSPNPLQSTLRGATK